jgi:hypothetical protein
MERQIGQGNSNTAGRLQANGLQNMPPTSPNHIHVTLQESTLLSLLLQLLKQEVKK